MPLPPEGPPSLGDRVLTELRQLVFSGEFSAGTRLTELGLVARLHASRTPVRQALAQLAHDGLLEPVRGGGFRVRGVEVQQVWDTFELRGVLEGTAARLAAERLTGRADLARLAALVEAMDPSMQGAAEKFATYFTLNDEYHRELRSLSKSDPLIRTIEGMVRFPFTDPRSLQFIFADVQDKIAVLCEAQRHHREIVDAIGNGDGPRAEALLREHNLLPRRTLERVLAHADPEVHLPSLSLLLRRAPETS